MTPQSDALTQFLTGMLLALVAVLVILNSLTRFIAPESLNPASLFRVFSLALAIEFLSIWVLLEKRRTIISLAEVYGRVFSHGSRMVHC